MRDGDGAALLDSIHEIESTGVWELAIKECRRLGDAPDEIRAKFLCIWIAFGDSLRSNVNKDFSLIAGLRVLLPPYAGGPVQLFRGESFGNRKRRTYGMAWSSDRQVATAFARNRADLYEGGTVLLETVAAPEAVISAPALLLPGASVDEYVVDRRRLRAVRVLERFKNPARE